MSGSPLLSQLLAHLHSKSLLESFAVDISECHTVVCLALASWPLGTM